MKNISLLFIVFLSCVSGASDVCAGEGQATSDTLSVHVDSLLVICQDADTLPAFELEKYITECDSLVVRIEKSDHARKRLMLFRLRKCRNYFAYLIETKRPEKSPDETP